MPKPLVQTIVSNTFSDWVKVRGRTLVHMYDDFGSGDATVQMQDPAGDPEPISIAFTVATRQTFNFNDKDVNYVRVIVANATSPALKVAVQADPSFPGDTDTTVT